MKVYFIVGLIFLSIVGVLSGIILYQNNKIDDLNVEIGQMKVQSQINLKTIDELKISAARNERIINDHNRRMAEVAKVVSKNTRELAEKKLNDLAVRKPNLVESAINKSTIELFNNFERETDPLNFLNSINNSDKNNKEKKK